MCEVSERARVNGRESFPTLSYALAIQVFCVTLSLGVWSSFAVAARFIARFAVVFALAA